MTRFRILFPQKHKPLLRVVEPVWQAFSCTPAASIKHTWYGGAGKGERQPSKKLTRLIRMEVNN